MTNVAPPLDLHDFRDRSKRIADARAKARDDFKLAKEQEDTHNHSYLLEKAKLSAAFRSDGVAPSAIKELVEMDEEVIGYRCKRDEAATRRKTALLLIEDLSDRMTNLRRDFEASQRVEQG